MVSNRTIFTAEMEIRAYTAPINVPGELKNFYNPGQNSNFKIESVMADVLANAITIAK